MSGGSLSTKGLVSGGGGSVIEAALLPPPSEPVHLGGSTSPNNVLIVIPTATNVCLMASDNITDNLRVQQSSSLVLPSMYKRAFLISYETDEIALVKP